MKGYTNVDGDSKLVIDVVTGISTTLWELKNIIKNIEWLPNLFDSISQKYVFKEVNFVADFVTSLDFEVTNLYIWDKYLPPEASRAILFDCIDIDCNHGHAI